MKNRYNTISKTRSMEYISRVKTEVSYGNSFDKYVPDKIFRNEGSQKWLSKKYSNEKATKDRKVATKEYAMDKISLRSASVLQQLKKFERIFHWRDKICPYCQYHRNESFMMKYVLIFIMRNAVVIFMYLWVTKRKNNRTFYFFIFEQNINWFVTNL